ncbi:MAG: MBOAT family protein [Leptospiraceae bacterium]|nr:MBOAT family protein [Leptospiraceae bacterium]
MLAGAGFSLQVYCDFSGYTDIARGTARLLGFEIPENFKAPYFSRSGRELWGLRWHITLNTWLRDYIYIPLGGSRTSRWRTHLNLIITFALGGLWHGADYSYVFWGTFWGVLLSLERFIEDDLKIPTTPRSNRPLIVAKVAFVFFVFCLGALMFRSHPVKYQDGRDYSSGHIMSEIFAGLVVNTPDAARDDYMEAGGDVQFAEEIFGEEIFTLNDSGQGDSFVYMFLALAFFHLVQYREGLFERWRKYDFWLLLLTGGIIAGILLPAMAGSAHQFIYFVF